MSYVYIIQSSNGYIKIGVSANPNKRLGDLQTANPHKLYLQLSIKCCDEESAYQLETLLHERYQDLQANGEWFDCALESVVKDISWAIKAASCIDGITRYSVVEEIRIEKVVEERVLSVRNENLSSGTRNRESSKIILSHLIEHPEDAAANVQELSKRLKVPRSTVSKYQRAFRSRQVAHE